MVLELEHLKGEISFKPQNTILVPLRGGSFQRLQDVWKVDKQLDGVQFGHRSQNLRYS